MKEEKTKKETVIELLKNCPTWTYQKIAEGAGCSSIHVAKIAAQIGIHRGKGPTKTIQFPYACKFFCEFEEWRKFKEKHPNASERLRELIAEDLKLKEKEE